MRALVTGCAGFIGSHLTDSLLASGDSVVGIDCLLENYSPSLKLANLEHAREREAFAFVQSDLTTMDLTQLIADCDVVFHLAAQPGVRASWGSRFDSYERNNVLATQRLLEAIKSRPEIRLIYASSSSVYGQAERLPTPEPTTPKPFSPYGVTKLAAEHLCQLYYGNYGVEIVCLRYFSVFGPRQRPDMAFCRFCRAAVERRPLRIFGDGSQSRDFTFVSDAVRATMAAAIAPGVAGKVYNIGGGRQVSLAAAIDVLLDVAGRPLDLRYSAQHRGDVAATGADVTRARNDLGYVPRVAFAEGLRAEFEWVRGNLELIATAAP